jgi:hypothetical protein
MTLVLLFLVSDGCLHPPDSGITLQCRLWCPTLVFDISSVVDAISDQLIDNAGPLCSTLKALNVAVCQAYYLASTIALLAAVLPLTPGAQLSVLARTPPQC